MNLCLFHPTVTKSTHCLRLAAVEMLAMLGAKAVIADLNDKAEKVV